MNRTGIDAGIDVLQRFKNGLDSKAFSGKLVHTFNFVAISLQLLQAFNSTQEQSNEQPPHPKHTLHSSVTRHGRSPVDGRHLVPHKHSTVRSADIIQRSRIHASNCGGVGDQQTRTFCYDQYRVV